MAWWVVALLVWPVAAVAVALILGRILRPFEPGPGGPSPRRRSPGCGGRGNSESAFSASAQRRVEKVIRSVRVGPATHPGRTSSR